MLGEVIPPVGDEGPVETPVPVFELVHRLRKLDLKPQSCFMVYLVTPLPGMVFKIFLLALTPLPG